MLDGTEGRKERTDGLHLDEVVFDTPTKSGGAILKRLFESSDRPILFDATVYAESENGQQNTGQQCGRYRINAH